METAADAIRQRERSSEAIINQEVFDTVQKLRNTPRRIDTLGWKAERAKLTAERKQLDREYYALKDVKKKPSKSARAFTVSSDRNSANCNSPESMTLTDRHTCGGIFQSILWLTATPLRRYSFNTPVAQMRNCVPRRDFTR